MDRVVAGARHPRPVPPLSIWGSHDLVTSGFDALLNSLDHGIGGCTGGSVAEGTLSTASTMNEVPHTWGLTWSNGEVGAKETVDGVTTIGEIAQAERFAHSCFGLAGSVDVGFEAFGEWGSRGASLGSWLVGASRW